MDVTKIVIFSIVVFAILLMWGGVMYTIIKYGHEVQTDPCSVCASRMGKDVICTMSGPGGTITRIYAKNETIIDSESINSSAYPSFNWSMIQK